MIHLIVDLQNISIIERHVVSVSPKDDQFPIVLDPSMSIPSRRLSVPYRSIRTCLCINSLILMRLSFSHRVVVAVEARVSVFDEERIHHFLRSWRCQHLRMVFLHLLFQHLRRLRRRKLRCLHWTRDRGKSLGRETLPYRPCPSSGRTKS